MRPGFVAERGQHQLGYGWHWSAGGQFLKPGPDGKPNRKAAFNDEQGAALAGVPPGQHERDHGQRARLRRVAPRWGAREQGAWYNDGISMGVNGSWSVGDFKRFGPHVDYGVAPPRPKGLEGTPVTWAGGFALAIPTGIKAEQSTPPGSSCSYYCYGKEAQLTFGSRTGQMPALMEAAEDKAYRESDPRMPVFVEVMKQAKIPRRHPGRRRGLVRQLHRGAPVRHRGPGRPGLRRQAEHLGHRERGREVHQPHPRSGLGPGRILIVARRAGLA